MRKLFLFGVFAAVVASGYCWARPPIDRYHVIYSADITGAKGLYISDLLVAGKSEDACLGHRLIHTDGGTAKITGECVVDVWGPLPPVQLVVSKGADLDLVTIGYKKIEVYGGGR